MFDINNIKLGIIGLGYVGLPLAVEFGKHYPTVGFDIDGSRVNELNQGNDHTLELSKEDLKASRYLKITSTDSELTDCNVYVISVPTPIDDAKRPNLQALESATKLVANLLKLNDIIIYESTVYPGATEEISVPLLEKISHLQYNRDFYVGYSPERINPGDKQHRLPSIVKVISGSSPESTAYINQIYRTIITAGTHVTRSIRVAEAAKVIENTQRDLNIALVNELSLIFDRLEIDTLEVLEAAGTKWNFLPFRPGLVGGHCIGVDPYYLTHKAQSIGYNPEIILAGRRINDGMGAHLARRVVKLMTQRKINPVDARVLILGLSFKENCPDVRNTRVIDIVKELRTYSARVDICDPLVSQKDASNSCNLRLTEDPQKNTYDAIILAVPHEQFIAMGVDALKSLGKEKCVLFDVKSVLPQHQVDGRL